MTAPDHRRIRSKDLLHRWGHPHMTHWSVFRDRESPTYQSRANRFHGQKKGPRGEAYLGSSLFKRRSRRLTLDPCHLPPSAEGTFLRFSSRAVASNEMTPFA